MCDQFQALDADVAVVAAYGLLLPQSILDAPRSGCINVHVSLLPRWRGAAPAQHAILAGDKESGVTIIQMDKGLDAGPILMQKAVPLSDEITGQQLYELLFETGGPMILQVLDLLVANQLHPLPQPDVGVTHAPKITKKAAFLDWKQPAISLERKVRAFNAWPGAMFTWHNQQIKVWAAKVMPMAAGTAPGTILSDDFVIACGQDALQILTLQLPGKKPMSVSDFKNGHPIPVGEVLSPCPVTS